jgi:hypothetical protein
MANSSKLNRTEIDRFTTKLQKQFGKIVTTTSMQMLGAEQVRQMKIRVRLGYGVRKELGKREAFKSLKHHSPSYTRYRELNSDQLDPETSPKMQNLTFTGQLVRDIRVIKYRKDSFVLGHSDKKRDGDSFSNKKLSKWVQEQGRPYMYVTDLEYKKLLRFYQNNIIKPTLAKI